MILESICFIVPILGMGALLCIIVIGGRRYENKIEELEKAVEWQRKKYETWRGYMNKGYRIAHDKTYLEMLMDRIR